MPEITKKNGMIVTNRGDDFSFRLSICANGYGDTYILNDKDAVYVGVMEPRSSFEDALIRKKYVKADQNEDGEITISMKSGDTENLLPGTYYLQAKLNQFVGMGETGEDEYEISTIVQKTKFIILD